MAASPRFKVRLTHLLSKCFVCVTEGRPPHAAPREQELRRGAAPLAANGFLPMALSSEKMNLDAMLELMVSHVDPCWVL